MYHHSHLNKCKLTKFSWTSFGGIGWQKFPLQRIAHPRSFPFQDTSFPQSRTEELVPEDLSRQIPAPRCSFVFRSAQRNTGHWCFKSMIIHDHPWSSIIQLIHVFVMQTSNQIGSSSTAGGVLFDRIFRSAARHRFGELGIQWAKAKAAE